MTNSQKETGILSGLAYGIVPHLGCIAFVLFAILGVTAATELFKPLLMNAYFFYGLIALSFVFATISAILYLKNNGILSSSGVKRKWKYLSTLYGSTLFINLFMFGVVFPYAVNLPSQASNTVQGVPASPVVQPGLTNTPVEKTLSLKVGIPCSGHASLIKEELNKLAGIKSIKFRVPDVFDVTYDSSKLSKDQILNLEIFKTYPATVESEV